MSPLALYNHAKIGQICFGEKAKKTLKISYIPFRIKHFFQKNLAQTMRPTVL